MRALLVGTVFSLVAATGCAPNNREQLDQAAEFEKRACACKEPACTDKVVADVKVWFDKYKDRRGTDADIAEVERRFTAMGECMAKVGMSDDSAKLILQIAEDADKL